MAHRDEQQDSEKYAARRGAISCLGWVGRCGLLGILGACVLLGLGMAPAQGAALAYITNLNSNTVSVIDTATNIVIATVPVGSRPHGVAVNPAGTRVYVTNNDSDTVSVIDTATHIVIATVLVGLYPQGVAVNPAGTRVYVANSGSGTDTVSVIDTAMNIVIATVPVGSHPVGVAVNPAGTRVYVANLNNNTVSVIDTATNIVIATVPVGGGPVGVAVNSAGTRVYVTNNDSHNMSVINTATHTVIATVPVGSTPQGVAVNPAGTRVYVANYYSDTVSVIDTTTHIVIATVPVGSGPSAFGQFIATSRGPVTKNDLVVNGNTLRGNQERWVRFVGEEIVSTLLGMRDQQLLVSSRSAWWGLKEGTFSLSNPYLHSVCNRQSNGRSKDVKLQPLETCERGRAWQVGLAAVQVPNFTETEVLSLIGDLWPAREVTDVLAEVAQNKLALTLATVLVQRLSVHRECSGRAG